MIAPHGGTLVDRILVGDALEEVQAKAPSLPSLQISHDLARDAQNICRGVFSPLEGFVGPKDLGSILSSDRLASHDVCWTIPIMLDVASADAVPTGDVCLYDETRPDRPLAIMHVEEVYPWDKMAAAEVVFGTSDMAHPGVAGYAQRGDFLVGGKLMLIDNDRGPYAADNRFPCETRQIFEERGWRTTVAFQTRNVPHAGHEDLQKTVLWLVDGLLIHPIIGKKKAGDFTDAAILQAYHALIDNYFARDRVLLNILPTEMRYAGPREAIMHAIMRKNYGCSHIIIGRDHAGVGKYYGEEEAIEIFARPQFADIEIEPIMIRGDFWYCKVCGRVASNRTCPHSDGSIIEFSGTVIRNGILDGVAPSEHIMRPEVFEVIRSFDNPFVQ